MVIPVIIGVSGYELTSGEEELIKTYQPQGVILFARNVEANSENGLFKCMNLIQSIKDLYHDQEPLISIDMEGGRVNRLKDLSFNIEFVSQYNKIFQQQYFDAFSSVFKSELQEKVSAQIFLSEHDEYQEMCLPAIKKVVDDAKQRQVNVKEVVFQYYYELGLLLHMLGINCNFAPLADIYHPDANQVVMGDRCFSDDPDQVIAYNKIALGAMRYFGVQGILKHMPGHGMAVIDSHFGLPIIENAGELPASLEQLQQRDFRVFRDLSNDPEINDCMAMTAHILFPDIDPELPITVSPKGIKYLREEIGFKGVIITDDLDMKALDKYSMEQRVKMAFAAGCDIVMGCNPVNAEILCKQSALNN